MRLLFSSASGLALTMVMASQGLAQAAPTSSDSINEVVVTGTRTSGLRAVDSPAPVQVLGNDILKRVGQPNLVQSLAQNIPSIQLQSFGTDQQEFNLSIKLRGLSPNQTLVLVDGQRRHGTANVAVSGGPYGGGAAPDLSFIPVGSIDHVEVLQDGAAAQYGTDAIAGVVNIILKKNASGGQISLTGGQYIDGGGLTGDVMANIGLKPFDNAYLNITAESQYHGMSFRGDIDPRVAMKSTTIGDQFTTTAKYPTAALFPDFPYVNRIGGDGLLRTQSALFNAGYDVTPNLQVYSFGSIGFKDGRGYENYRVPDAVTGVDTVNDRPFPAGFSPLENDRDTDYSISLGVRGEAADTTFDVNSTYGRDYDRIYVLGSINAQLYKDTSTAAAKGSSPFNFHDGDFTATQWSNTVNLTHTLEVGLPEPVTFAAGGEYRIDSYQIKAGDPASYYGSGAQSFFGYGPANAGYNQRHNWAGYGDIAIAPVRGLKLDGAVRYEAYSDFGDTTVGKVTARYDFTEALALRGTVSTGFRAPTLAEEFYSGINVGPTSVSGVFPPNSPGAKFLGVSGLGPEKSTNFSVGVVTHFLPALTMTLDAYSIKIDNRIVQSGTLYGYNSNKNVVTSQSVIDALAANHVGYNDAQIRAASSGSIGVQTFVNGVDTQTRGLDFVATLPRSYGDLGHVDYSFTANYNVTTVTRLAAPPSNVSSKVVLLDAAAISGLEDSTPKYRATVAAYWTLGKFSVNLRESYYGSSFTLVQDPRFSFFDRLNINPALLTDLEFGYEVIPGVKVFAGGNNIGNVYPTKDADGYRAGLLATSASGYANSVYPSSSPFGINGGYYYGRLSWTF